MSTRELPARPNLEHLKNQARTLLNEALNGDSSAASRLAAAGVTSQPPKLADALHTIAREYGFKTWPELKLQVEVNSEDPMSALVAAMKGDDAKLLREVLARHPSLRATINEPLQGVGFDEPALVIAAHRNNREMIDALLDAGADINARSRWWAGSFGVLDWSNEEISSHLIARGAIVDIHAAARLGMTGRVRELLAKDPSLVNARGGDGQFPLHFAATTEIAEILLDAGADIDAQDIDHESTALQYIVSLDPPHHDVARYLISRGAKVDIFAASAVGDYALVEEMINDDPELPRHTITERYIPKKDPRSGGSIYFYRFGITKTPHILARQFGHAEVFKLLMQRSPVWIRVVQYAEIGDEEKIRETLERHPTAISRVSEAASRRIIGTTIRNNARAVELLLKYGWPATPRMDNQQTALHYAAWHGNLQAVNALLPHFPDPNIFETEHGGTPLAWALYGSLNSWQRKTGNYPAVATMLLEAGAHIPQTERPLEGTEETLEVIERYRARQ